VHNLNAVKQQLWGLEMEAPCAVGDAVQAPDGTKLGRVTSYIDTPSGALGMLVLCACALCKLQSGPHQRACNELPRRAQRLGCLHGWPGAPAAHLRGATTPQSHLPCNLLPLILHPCLQASTEHLHT